MEVDRATLDKIEKGRTRHATQKPGWAEQIAFMEGRQFVYKALSGSSTTLSELETREFGSKPRHRARTARNLYQKYILAEVSQGVQRIPSYSVTPTTTDPDDISAARLSEKILLDLYQRLNLRSILVAARMYSVICGQGYIRPWWNPKIGASYGDGVSEGEICLEVYGPDEVFGEAGTTFEKSPWIAVETARSIEDVKNLPGFNGAKLTADVHSSSSLVGAQLSTKSSKADAVLLTEFLELPSTKHPKGRRMFIANGQAITEPEEYPMPIQSESGYEHVVHKMSYIPTPWKEWDQGLGQSLVDPQRTLNDVVNKAIQWKNQAIRPQMLAPVGSIIDRATDEDGLIIRYRPIGGLRPEWREAPPIPNSLFQMADQAIAHMEEIASQRSLPEGIESGKALSAIYERDSSVHAFILQTLADFHSKLGRHLLLYAQKYYSESRLLQIRGTSAADSGYVMRFKGADIKGQTNVLVTPESIAPQTQQAVEQRVLAYADRGWISPQQAMAAIDGGYAEDLSDDYELDVGKQRREIDQMIAMGEPSIPGGDVPIAASYDNHEVHLYELHKFMKSRDFETQPLPVQEAATAHEQQHQQLQMEAQAQAQAAQIQTAEQLGMANAARPTQKQMPDLPSTSQ